MRLNLSSLLGGEHSGWTSAPVWDEVMDVARGLYIFEWLGDDILRSIVSSCQIREFDAGQTIFAVGDVSDGNAYAILSGAVEIIMGDNTATASAHGMLFGENALISSDDRDHTVRARERTRCLVIGQDMFMSFASEHYDLNKVMYRAIQRDFDMKNPNGVLGQ